MRKRINERQGSDPDERKWILQQYETLQQFPEWEDEVKAGAQGNNRSLEFLERVHDCHEYTTEYFLRLERDHKYFYRQLVETHVVQAVNYWGDAWQNIRDGKARFDPTWARDWISEGVHQYWDYLPLVVVPRFKQRRARDGDSRMVPDERLVEEAWIMMMFRAMCWWRCHWMDYLSEKGMKSETRLKSQYWNSKFQVYVG